jgi:hypothetical protein
MVSTGGGGFDLPMGGSPLAILVIVVAVLAVLWFLKERF